MLRFSLMPEGNVHHPPTQALLRGQPLLFEHFTPECLAQSGHTEEHARVIQQVGAVSGIFVPLIARGSTLGVLSFFTSCSGRHYTQEDLSVAEELARRVALSLDNARLYARAQEAVLLDVSRISAGRMKLTWEPVDFAVVVREVVSRYEDQADKQGTSLRVDAPASLVGTWDAMRLEQVVVNLLDNALKYGPGKPVRLRLVEDSGRAILTVKDEGIGIAPGAQGRIFERFMRAVSDRHYGGLGLGLYITKSCVEAMGGSIHVQSEPGQGALFTVVLPRSAPA